MLIKHEFGVSYSNPKASSSMFSLTSDDKSTLHYVAGKKVNTSSLTCHRSPQSREILQSADSWCECIPFPRNSNSAGIVSVLFRTFLYTYPGNQTYLTKSMFAKVVPYSGIVNNKEGQFQWCLLSVDKIALQLEDIVTMTIATIQK